MKPESELAGLGFGHGGEGTAERAAMGGGGGGGAEGKSVRSKGSFSRIKERQIWAENGAS